MRIKRDVALYLKWWLLHGNHQMPWNPLQNYFREKGLVEEKDVGYECSHSLTDFDYFKGGDFIVDDQYFHQGHNTIRVDLFRRNKNYISKWNHYEDYSIDMVSTFWLRLQNNPLTRIDDLPRMTPVEKDWDFCFASDFQRHWTKSK